MTEETRIAEGVTDALTNDDPKTVAATLKKAEEGLDPSKTSTLLAGKYKSREDLINGLINIIPKAGDDTYLESLYKLLEKRIGAPANSQPPTAEEIPQNSAPLVNEDSASGESAGGDSTGGEAPNEDFSYVVQEFQETGALSEDSYKKLEEAGFDRTMVDTYLDGIRYRAQQVYQQVGGEENYKAMMQWGANNLSREEQEAFDKALAESEASRRLAIDGLWKRYTAAHGPQFTRPVGANSAAYSVEGFASKAQFIMALKDPRYQVDPAYRQSVIDRLRVSKFI